MPDESLAPRAAPRPGAEQEDRVRFAWLARVFGWLLYRYVHLVAATLRPQGPPINQGQAVLAVWHESNLVEAVVVWGMRADRRNVSFSTRGFRGIVMNTMLEGLEAGVMALPPEGERAEAARLTLEMARYGHDGWSLVLACDGPLGPRRVAKPGALLLARESGLAIQPWAISARPAIRLTRRWDRQIVPLPFCRLRVDEGRLIEIGKDGRLKAKLAELQDELDRVSALADARMAGRLAFDA